MGFLQIWWGSSKADGVGEFWVGLTKKSMGLTYNVDVTKGSPATMCFASVLL